MTEEEYVDFDVETCSSLPVINSDMVDWWVSSVKACVTEYLTKECGDLNEVASDNDDDKDFIYLFIYLIHYFKSIIKLKLKVD